MDKIKLISEANSDKLYLLLYSKLAEKYKELRSPTVYYQFPGENAQALWAFGSNAEWLEFEAGNRMSISKKKFYLPIEGIGGSVFYNYRNWIFAIITPGKSTKGNNHGDCGDSDSILHKIRQANIPMSPENENYRNYLDSGTETTITAGITRIINQDGNTLTEDLTEWRQGNNLTNWSAVLAKNIEPKYKNSAFETGEPGKNSQDYSHFIYLYLPTSDIQYKNKIIEDIYDDDYFCIEVLIAGLGYYTVSRTAWFSSELLHLYKNYELYPPETSGTYFNPEDGILTLIPMALIIGWNITFNVTVSDAYYEKYKQLIQQGYGISIGSIMITGIPRVIDGVHPNTKILSYQTPEKKIQTLDPQILGYISYHTTVDIKEKAMAESPWLSENSKFVVSNEENVTGGAKRCQTKARRKRRLKCKLSRVLKFYPGKTFDNNLSCNRIKHEESNKKGGLTK